jgi:hypothetical protein
VNTRIRYVDCGLAFVVQAMSGLEAPEFPDGLSTVRLGGVVPITCASEAYGPIRPEGSLVFTDQS